MNAEEIVHSENAAQIVVGLSDPHLLHALLDHYNWDDGFEVPLAIANNPACELATAIRLFWLADGGSWIQMSNKERAKASDHDAFCSALFGRITAGSYSVVTVSYVKDLPKVAQYKFEKAGLPPLFWQPVESGMPT